MGDLLLMPSGKSYQCPHNGCGQTSRRRWNMDVHIKRTHGGRYPSSASITGSTSVPNPMGYPLYGVHHRQDTSTDALKQIERTQDQNMESIRKFNGSANILAEFRRQDHQNHPLTKLSNY
jgi:hypothetical protein